MAKTRRKTIRPKKAQKRTDHPAGCRVNDDELARVRRDISELTEHGGITPSVGAYTKHALLSHRRLRMIEGKLRHLIQTLGFDQGLADTPPFVIIEKLQAILEAP